MKEILAELKKINQRRDEHENKSPIDTDSNEITDTVLRNGTLYVGWDFSFNPHMNGESFQIVY